MPDRYSLELHTAVASNTGGPFVTTWSRVVVPETGTVRSVAAVAKSITSNAHQNTVEVYRQTSAPAAGSNTATTILVSPITLSNTLAVGFGAVRQSGAYVTAGDMLELRTYSGSTAAQPSFTDLTATVVIEKEG
jgi:hypothetical protein